MSKMFRVVCTSEKCSTEARKQFLKIKGEQVNDFVGYTNLRGKLFEVPRGVDDCPVCGNALFFIAPGKNTNTFLRKHDNGSEGSAYKENDVDSWHTCVIGLK